jgi:polysaccharide deacetylase 2 family uncharacterized protein YibQ
MDAEIKEQQVAGEEESKSTKTAREIEEFLREHQEYTEITNHQAVKVVGEHNQMQYLYFKIDRPTVITVK